MKVKKSAGILLYRYQNEKLELFLAHPGGPFWKNKDQGAWSIPKGEYDDAEDPFAAALREFNEETGMTPKGEFIPLTPVKLRSGKIITAWACRQDIPITTIIRNTFKMEWPPRSGKMQHFPEIDRVGWFRVDDAISKINPTQSGFLSELLAKL